MSNYLTSTKYERSTTMENLGIASVAAVTIICYLIGIWCKSTPRIKDELIPAIMGLCGALIGIIAKLTNMPEFEGTHIVTAIAIGIVSGLAATGINQIYKQLNKG